VLRHVTRKKYVTSFHLIGGEKVEQKRINDGGEKVERYLDNCNHEYTHWRLWCFINGSYANYDIFAFFKYQSMDLISLIFDTLFFIAPIYVIISGICLHKLQRQWIVSNIVIAVFGILLLIFLYLIPDIRIVPNATMEIEALLFRIILFSLIIYFIWSIIYLTRSKATEGSPERAKRVEG